MSKKFLNKARPPIEKKTFQAPTSDLLMSKIRHAFNGFSFSSGSIQNTFTKTSYSGFTIQKNGKWYIVAIHNEKHRKRVQVQEGKFFRSEKKPGYEIRNRVVTKPKYWIATVELIEINENLSNFKQFANRYEAVFHYPF
jgi:hypothetical protein